MRRSLLVPLLVCAWLAAPPPADAWILRWIDEMSGPGPYVGVQFQLRLKCFSPKDEQYGIEPPPYGQQSSNQPSSEQESSADLFQRFYGVGTPCFGKAKYRERRQGSFDLGIGYFQSTRNDLDYGDAPVDRDVSLWTVEPSIWFHPARYLGVGASVGVYWFQGEAFKDFGRVTVQPVMVDVKPFAMLNDALDLTKEPWHEIVSIRSSIVFIPIGYDAETFGARPGTFDVDRDVLPTIMLFIDAEPLVRQLKKRR